MAQTNFAQRFTDNEYLSKKEITNVLGPSYLENAWRLTSDYREKYRFPVTLKRFDNFPFTIVLTPAIMAHANSAERKLFEYSLLFENYKVKESISDNKVLQKYKEGVVKSDLLALAQNAALEVGERDIELMLEPSSLHLKSSQVYGYYQAMKYLSEEATTYTVSRNLVRDTYNKIVNIDEKITKYRNKETFSGDGRSLNPQDILGAPTNRIMEFMDRLFEFYEADFELSPFIIGAIIYAYILYVIPFERYSEYVATLIVQKVLAEKGYGEACYYLSLPQYMIKKEQKLKVAFENTRTSGDLTYVIVFLCDLISEALNWKISNIQTLEVPTPVRDEVKIVEKIVEVPVVKNVEVIKEVIKEVPVEKIVYVEKSVPVSESAPVIEKKVVNDPYQDVNTSLLGEHIDVEHTDDDEPKIREYHEPDDKVRGDYDFIDDPFASKIKPVGGVNRVVQPAFKEETTVKSANVEVMDMREDVKRLIDLPPEELAKGLVEINPLIRYHQALFYANHHDFGRYYTIGNFKKFSDCAYETARTSMEFLVSLGLYRKEQLKNKFVYTPNKIVGDDE